MGYHDITQLESVLFLDGAQRQGKQLFSHMTESNPNEKRCHTSSSTILRRVVLPLFLLLAFALTWAKNYGVVFDTNSSSTVRQKSGQKSSATTKAWHKQAAVSNATEMAMLLIHSSSKPTKKDAQRQQFKKRFVFFTHYHKTGHDISKQYRKAVEEIVGARAAQSFNILSSDEWEVEFYKKRKHDETTRCPLPEDPNKAKRRRERRPKKNIYNSNDESLSTTSNNNNNSTTFLKVLHSPDLFCNLQTNHVFSEDTIKGFQKIHGDNNDGAYDHDDSDEQVVINFVHFIRDPFDMAVSNYLYHSQSPTPESWVIESPRTSKPCDPCVLDRNMLKLFLAAADDDDATTETTTKAKTTTTTTTTNEPVGTELWVRNVEETCKALMRRKENNKVAYYKNYYEALRSLPAIDGLRLATIHLTMGGSNSGSDILRLAHNTIRLREWEEEQKKRQQQQQKNQPQTTSEPKFVLTLLTNPDWFDSNYPGTLDKLTHFVLGGDDEDDDDLHYFAKTVRETALTRRDEIFKKRKNHFTSGTISSEDRLDLLRSLQTDELLGPLLRDVQSIVRDAWCGDPRNIQQQQGKGNDTKRCVYPHTFEQTTNSN